MKVEIGFDNAVIGTLEDEGDSFMITGDTDELQNFIRIKEDGVSALMFLRSLMERMSNRVWVREI